MKRSTLHLGTLFALLSLSSLASAQIYINFGDVSAGDPNITDLEKAWNNAGGDIDIPDLLNLDGLSSGASLTWDTGFYGKTGGLDADIEDFVAAANARAAYSRDVTIELAFTGLDASTNYDISFFAHRTSYTNDRSGTYTFSGLTTEAIVVNGNALNTSLSSVSLLPDAEGSIGLSIAAAPSNDSGGYIYLNSMKIEEGSISAIPEPSSAIALAGVSGFIGFMLRRRMR